MLRLSHSFLEVIVNTILRLLRSRAVTAHLLRILLRLFLDWLIQLQSIKEIFFLVLKQTVKSVTIELTLVAGTRFLMVWAIGMSV
jgi:hypothetical protein